MLISVNPAKKSPADMIFSVETLPDLNRKQPTSRLKSDQSTFVNGEDNPLPGGFEKGVGKGSPVIPLIKCGKKFARNIPAPKPLR